MQRRLLATRAVRPDLFFLRKVTFIYRMVGRTYSIDFPNYLLSLYCLVWQSASARVCMKRSQNNICMQEKIGKKMDAVDFFAEIVAGQETNPFQFCAMYVQGFRILKHIGLRINTPISCSLTFKT